MLRRNWFRFVGAILPMAALSFAALADDKKPTDKPAGTPPPEKKADEKKPQAKHEGKPEAKAKDIVDTAMADPNFSTLCDLLKAAKLVDTLKSGDYTVFAPTNDAFKKIDAATLADWKKPENEKKLRDILTYHVVKGKMMAADVTKAKTVKTVQGGEAGISEKDKTWMIDNAKITKTDIACANGVIHVIDTVIMPKESKPK
ncbi:Immunogenic protein MPT70 precursor [Phycisphaerae bacterium RAS1]|nr:Immunogenic protein MPT70 precursor [Phycisphaerae bacterium RAS1]